MQTFFTHNGEALPHKTPSTFAPHIWSQFLIQFVSRRRDGCALSCNLAHMKNGMEDDEYTSTHTHTHVRTRANTQKQTPKHHPRASGIASNIKFCTNPHLHHNNIIDFFMQHVVIEHDQIGAPNSHRLEGRRIHQCVDSIPLL